jgi:hypothetical protein
MRTGCVRREGKRSTSRLGGPFGCADHALDVNLLQQFGQEPFELRVTDERASGDLGKPPFNMGPLIRHPRVGVALGEIAGVAGEHAVGPAIRTSLCERDEMVDAGFDFAIPLDPWESNVAVGASSAPIEIAALVDHVGH